jgi:spore coat polysaccharide biosynthesis predicted glycosyltransferase SpsG
VSAVVSKYIIIPACKKDAFFTDDLMIKIGPRSLLENTIKLAISITTPSSVTVVTDSHEVSNIVNKYGCQVKFDNNISFKNDGLDIITTTFNDFINCDYLLIILSPYLSNLSTDDLIERIEMFWQSGAHCGFSAQMLNIIALPEHSLALNKLINNVQDEGMQQLEGFIFYRPQAPSPKVSLPLIVPSKTRPVRSIDEFWVAERQYQAQKIIFRIIGNKSVGMGHIYRSISLAKLLLGHDIQFICREEDKLALETIAGYHFPVLSFTPDQEVTYITSQSPDLIINDTLSTSSSEVQMLKKSGAYLVTLEDKGAGLDDADLVINEIFSEASSAPDHVYSGHQYVLLRDEFLIQDLTYEKNNRYQHCLISFGGSDPSNYTQLVLSLFDDLFHELKIKVTIILGQGYTHKDSFYAMLDAAKSHQLITVIESTDQIAKLMANADFAFSGNGRMVFELAQMRLPAIILSQNKRELTHDFAQQTEGFCFLGIVDNTSSCEALKNVGETLLRSDKKRSQMIAALKNYDFMVSKQNVYDLILPLLCRPDEIE